MMKKGDRGRKHVDLRGEYDCVSDVTIGCEHSQIMINVVRISEMGRISDYACLGTRQFVRNDGTSGGNKSETDTAGIYKFSALCMGLAECVI